MLESEKAVCLCKNLEIIKQVLDGSFDHGLAKNYTGMGDLYVEIKERESELVQSFGKDRYLKLIVIVPQAAITRLVRLCCGL